MKIIELIIMDGYLYKKYWSYQSLLILVMGVFPYSIQAKDAVNLYQIDAEASDIRILVYKTGAMKFMGHNHVVRAIEFYGVIHQSVQAPDIGDFDLQIPLSGFVVDRPVDRKRSGEAFSNDIDADSAQSTRKNMFRESVLDAGRYPYINVSGKAKDKIAELEISIKGRINIYTVPVDIAVTNNSIAASGKLEFNQSDFGIEPFSLFGGMLAVQDEVTIEFEINAKSKQANQVYGKK